MLNGATFSSPESAFYEYQTKMENQLCQVCHSLAAGFHHGAYVCEACKKFFKRYSTNQLKSSAICKNNCNLEKIGRRKCSYCRYQKCLNVGMKFSGLRSKESNIDISKIPCRVCGGKSSGFHFGSLTCEGCKGFFRRAEPMKDRLECVTGKFNCIIDTTQKLPCKSCRYRRCVEVGMSKIGSRIGRQPNAVKHHCALEIINYHNSNSSPNTPDHVYQVCETNIIHSIDNDESGSMIPFSSSINLDLQIKFSKFLDGNLQTFLMKAVEAIDILQTPLTVTDRDSHFDNIPFNIGQSPLEVWNNMMKHFDIHTRILIYFAKKLPGFNELSLNDKRNMVQDAMYSVILLNLSNAYQDEAGESFNYFDFTKEQYEVILNHFPQLKQILVHVMEISRIIYNLKISKMQIGFLCLIELSKNYENLESIDTVKMMHRRIVRLFWISILIDLENGSVNTTDTSLPKISLLLVKLQCPDDLKTLICSKVPKFLEDHWCQKLHLIFNLLSDILHRFNIEHQSIINQLKKTKPGLPFPELYREMFQQVK